jgi:hypothetical protein
MNEGENTRYQNKVIKRQTLKKLEERKENREHREIKKDKKGRKRRRNTDTRIRAY